MNKLEKSLSILLSLYVMIEQNLEALFYYEDHLSENSSTRKSLAIPDKSAIMIDEAISESLWFQIILKSCSFLEEWDKILGILTETEYSTKIQLIKKVVKPSRKAINRWSDLKNFRNEIIAHNFRNTKGEFKLYSIADYNCPQTDGELWYLVAFLNRMINVLTANLPLETVKIQNSFGEFYSSKALNTVDSGTNEGIDLKKILFEVDARISEEIFEIPRYEIMLKVKDYLSSLEKNEN